MKERCPGVLTVGDGDIAADTVSKIIHKRRRKASDEPCSQPAPVVNNFAAKEMDIVNNLPLRHLGSGAQSAEAGTGRRRYPRLLPQALDLTEIIEAIAKNTSDLPQCLNINPNL